MPFREELFWKRVEKTDGCWLWRGRVHRGYGYFTWDDASAKKNLTRRAHRVAWELAHGPIEKGLCVCHRCDVPACVNPAHLFLGTVRENLADMVAKGRSRGLSPKDRRGESHPNAKLTAAKVEEIHALRAKGLTYREIGERIGVSGACASDVCQGRSWKARDAGP